MLDLISYKAVLDNISDGVYILDGKRRITYWSKAAERLTGFSSDEVVGTCCYDNILTHVDCAGTSLCKEFCPVARTLLDGQPREAQVFLHHKDGHRVPVKISTSVIRNATGNIVSAVEVFSDDSHTLATRASMETLKKHSMNDLGTGLPNRKYIETRIQSRLDELQRFGWPMSVFLAEVDHYTELQKDHPPAFANRVMKMIGMSLAGAVRSLDTVGRWDDNCFLALLANTETDALQAVTERARMLVNSSSLRTANGPHRVTVSVGASSAEAGDTMESLLRRAEVCLYHSRTLGRNCVTIHSPERA